MTDFCPIPPIEWTDPGLDPVEGVLTWPLDMSQCSAIETDPVPSDAIVNQCVAAAIQTMFVMTRSRYFVCQDTIYPPCIQRVYQCCSNPYDLCTGCAICDWRRIDLLEHVSANIISIDSVHIGATLVPSTEYWLSNGRYLVPKRDGQLWPWPLQDPNVLNWSITLTHGRRPPELVMIAAQDLACQLINFALNRPCDIPPNAVTVTREGIQVSLKTGIQSVASVMMALEAYGGKNKSRSRITDPAAWGEAQRINS